MRTRILAQEELNDEAGTPQEQIAAFVDAPENDLAEATAAATDVEQAQDELTQAADTAETLETVADRAEETLPEGGMSEADAASLEVAVEGMVSLIGMRTRKKVFPSMENFTDPKDRVAATKLAIEGIREKAGEIWKAIVAAIQKAVEFVKNFFVSLFNAAKGLDKRAELLIKQANQTKGTVGEKIKGNTALNDGSKPLDGAGVLAAYDKHVSLGIFKADRMAAASKALEDVEALVKLGDLERGGEKAFDELSEAMSLMGVGGKVVKHGENGAVVQAVELPLGGKSLFVETTAAAATDKVVARLQKLGGSKSYVGNTSDKKADIAAAEVAPMDSASVSKVANTVRAHLKTYDAAKSNVDKLESASKQLISKLSEVGKKHDGASDEVVKAASGAIRGVINVLVNGNVSLRKFDITLAKQVLDFAGASLKSYKAEAKAA